VVATLAFGVLAVAFAAWSPAAPWNAAGRDSAAAKGALPALPAAVKSRKRWEIGVKCDYPPFGFVKADGKHAGYDVDVAYRFAELAFGKRNRVNLTCVTTPSRIPTLMSGRVDIIISTLTYTQQRDEQIDFSIPYYDATGRLLVPNDSSIRAIRDLNGASIVTTRGSVYDRWVKNCFKSARLAVFDSPSAAYLALKDRRADTFMFDDAYLLNIAANDNQLRLSGLKFLALPWGIGIRQGDTVTKRWVDAAVRLMTKRNEFLAILKRNSPRRYHKAFAKNVPQPGKRIVYPKVSDPAELCPSS
jgi:polar amino acid transport system substrate-binding protein